MQALANAIVVIISQYIRLSNQHILLKLIQCDMSTVVQESWKKIISGEKNKKHF